MQSVLGVRSVSDIFCCSRKMEVALDLGRFTEMQCQRCGDVIYVKKAHALKPVMIDD